MKNLTSRNIGLVLGLLMVAASATMFYGLKMSEKGNTLFTVLTIFSLGIVTSLIIFKKRNPGDHPFKEYFSEGFKTFIIAVFIMVVYNFIFYKINPQILENALAESNKYAYSEGNHTPKEISENNDKIRSMFIPMTLMMSMIGYLILGSIISVLGAGFLSQKRS